MKNIFKFLVLAGVSLLAVYSCSKAEETDIEDKPFKVVTDGTTGESIVTVQLNVPVSDQDTKTTLGTKDGSSYPVLWSAGDVITLNGTEATEFTRNSGNLTATAKFKVTNLSAPFNFLYRGVAGQSNQVTFPASQSYVAGGFDPAAMPMYASVANANTDITFSHVGALLKFSFTGTKKIDAVNLSAADGTKSLSGNFTIGANGSGILNGTLTPAASGAGLTYSFGGHIQLSDTPFVFYVAIPAGTYEGGINLTIVDNDSGHMNVTVMDSDAKKTIAAGKVREFDNVVYIPAKENNLKQIWDLETFQEFVSAVAGGNKTLNARLTPKAASIDLSSIAGSFASIEGYKGTFDGNDKTLDFGTSTATQPLFDDLHGVVKNLTVKAKIEATANDNRHWGIIAKKIIPSLEVDDVPGLQNCTTASGSSITWTPASDAGGNYMTLGGLVGDNKGGTITGCTNNAAVTFANNSITHTNQPSVGGVVGRTQKGGDLKTQGEISNCTNNGTVVCAAQFSQGAYIGGVLGYQVEKAETMSGCTNHGLVKVTSTFSTSGALHIAGVAGMAKGTVENCTNASDGVVTSEACTVGTYFCQGGVVGRLNGTATYSTLTNAGTLNVAALGGSTARLIGGVVGRCNEGATLDGVTNSGNINYTAEDTHDTYIGGVVAHNDKAGIVLENCNSTGGTLTVSNASHSGALYVGGVVGYSTKAVTSCSNAMTIATSGSMTQGSNSYLCFGGVIGYLKEAVLATNCANSGAINFGQTQSSEGQLYIGGIAGAVTDAEINGGSNSGTITFTGQNTKRPPCVGGIVGRVFSNTTDSGYSLNNNVTNTGSIVFNSSVSSSQYMYAGGLVGQHLGGNIYGTNNAPITVTELHESMMALGGIVGYLAGGTVSNGTNTSNGDIAVNGFISGYHSYVGGIVGIASGDSSIQAGGGTITGASNAGDVTVAAGCTIPRNNYVGGVIAYAGNSVSNASNSGNIVNNYSQTSSSNGSYHFNIAGVVGYSAVALSSCYNTGNVTNNGTTYKSEINVAGVVGWCEGDLTSCSNGTNSLPGGAISNIATSGTNTIKDAQIAGVVANNRGRSLTSCFNKGAISNSGACLTGSVGGIVAWSNNGTATYTGCYNTGSVSNTGTCSTKASIGGLIGYTKGLTTVSGSANYNNGAVSEASTSSVISIGGISGFYEDVSEQEGTSTFAGSQNRSSGIITIGGSHTTTMVGGILGNTDYSPSLSTCSNAGAINFTNCTATYVRVGGILGVVGGDGVPGISGTNTSNWTTNSGNIKFTTCSISGQLTAGGIFGAWENDEDATIQYCKNSGTITTNTQDKSSEDICTSKMSAFSYIGGIGTCTSSNGWGKTFTHCQNTGDIKLYFNTKHRVGGITGVCVYPPSYCDVQADLIVGMPEAATDAHNAIGGIAGILYHDSVASKTFNNLFFNGNVKAEYDHGDKRSYITGLLAVRPNKTDTEATFNNCKVGGGTLYCNQWSGYYRPGLFTGHNVGSKNVSTQAPIINCSGCQVLSGTVIQYGTGTTTINSTVDYRDLVGNTGPRATGTASGVTVVNSISPNTPFN